MRPYMSVKPFVKDLNTYVMSLAHTILREETKEKNIQMRCQKITTEHPGMHTYLIIEKITEEILQIIRDSVEKDPFVSEEKNKQYMPNIDDLYQARLLLVLQKQLRIHPFS